MTPFSSRSTMGMSIISELRPFKKGKGNFCGKRHKKLTINTQPNSLEVVVPFAWFKEGRSSILVHLLNPEEWLQEELFFVAASSEMVRKGIRQILALQV